MRYVLLALLSISLSSAMLADVIVIDDSARRREAVERAFREESQKAHEREMQQRQLEHEAEMQRQRIEAQKAATAVVQQASASQPAALVFDQTNGLFNGRSWITWPIMLKTAYVAGTYEAAAGTTAGQGIAEILKTRATYGEIVAGVDLLYSDSAMLPVPLAYVIPIFAAKSRGALPDEVEGMKAGALASISR
jgi:hypothetical protein